MGSPVSDRRRKFNELLYKCVALDPYMMAATETTMAQYREFSGEEPQWRIVTTTDVAPTHDVPQGTVSWFAAAAYCNWLSRHEGLPEVFLPNEQGKLDYGMRISADAANTGGYRLPTEAEWEYACRAGSGTPYQFGTEVNWGSRYMWTAENSESQLHPVGELLPNDLGLFDMHGNVQEWTINAFYNYPGTSGVHEEGIKDSTVDFQSMRVARGGAFSMLMPTARCAYRHINKPDVRVYANGFRVVRTVP